MTVDLDALAARVARLEAIELAKVASVRYGRACDAKDVDALRNDVFTPDAVLRLPNREAHGIDAIVRSYAGAFAAEPGTRRHFMVNQVGEVAADGSVLLDSYFFFVSQDRESVIGWGAYRDVVAVDDGVGRISDKTISIDVYSTIGAGWAMDEATAG